MRTIRKYPNRRLYDTTESRYITLQDIRQLVLTDEPFEVIDQKTDGNITRSILLQVIAEQEQHGPSVMSEDFLTQVIRSSRGTVPQKVTAVLEQSLANFFEQQKHGETLRGATEPGRDA
jgi:polyhydroxyalkanoate synthesis repressor PhaR